MQHMLNNVSRNVSKCSENVWYVDLGASNHMTSHGEWFKDLQTLRIWLQNIIVIIGRRIMQWNQEPPMVRSL